MSNFRRGDPIKSQLNQDINVINYYNKKQGGFFIEIGSDDGVQFSNTHLLEKQYGWKGICVEPNSDSFSKLIQNRNCKCYNLAVYNKSNEILKFAVKNFSMCSGLIDELDEHVNIDGKIHERGVNNDLKKITEVTTITLTDLLDTANAPNFIDYMSLDTEGSELEILKSNDFTRYNFGVIDVEHNFVEPRRTEIRNLLESNNYKFNFENKFDDNYIWSGNN